MSNNSYKFSGKYIIKGDMRCITGLHIGGTDEGFEIGGMENPVIKDPITGYPYIVSERKRTFWKSARAIFCCQVVILKFETRVFAKNKVLSHIICEIPFILALSGRTILPAYCFFPYPLFA